jgi:hypothetical protein
VKTYFKAPVILVGFEIKVNFLSGFWKNAQISNFTKSVQWKQSCSMRTDGRMDGHEKANSRFSQFCERV